MIIGVVKVIIGVVTMWYKFFCIFLFSRGKGIVWPLHIVYKGGIPCYLQ